VSIEANVLCKESALTQCIIKPMVAHIFLFTKMPRHAYLRDGLSRIYLTLLLATLLAAKNMSWKKFLAYLHPAILVSSRSYLTMLVAKQ
jgi:hypothetical protein